ncbi:MAG: hypothetical protein RLZZ571_34 [Actinomycetota bacterium]
MSAALAVIAAFGYTREWPDTILVVLLVLAAVHLILAFVAPGLLGRINSIWMGLGFLLGKVVSPIVMTILFFVLFTPIGLVMKLIGRDELALKSRGGNSFWKIRTNPQITAESFKYQY